MVEEPADFLDEIDLTLLLCWRGIGFCNDCNSADLLVVQILLIFLGPIPEATLYFTIF